jgi:hypothetical protein
VLSVTVLGAAAILSASGETHAEPEPVPVIYSILNMTERMADRHACPLDLVHARELIETRYAATGYRLEFSPLADGPDVLLHEFAATVSPEPEASTAACAWTVHVSFQGATATYQSTVAPSSTPLERVNLTPLPAASPATDTR